PLSSKEKAISVLLPYEVHPRQPPNVFVLSATTMFRPSLTAAANAPMQQHAIHAPSVRAPMSSLSQIPSWRSRHVNATFVRDLVRRDAANAAARDDDRDDDDACTCPRNDRGATASLR